MSTDLESIAATVEQLRRENVRIRRTAAVLLILVLAALLMGQSGPIRKLECESFVLRASDGSVRATLAAKDQSTELSFYGSHGKQQLSISSNVEGEGIVMRDDSGAILATMSVAFSPTGSTFGVLGNPGGPGVVINTSKEIAIIRVDNKTGRRVWAVSSDAAPATPSSNR